MGKTVIPAYLHDNKIVCYDIAAKSVVEYDCDKIGEQSSCAGIPIAEKSLEYIAATGWPHIINTRRNGTLFLNVVTLDKASHVHTVIGGTADTVNLLYVKNGKPAVRTVSYADAFDLFNKFELNAVPIINGAVFGFNVDSYDKCVVQNVARHKSMFRLNTEYIESLSRGLPVENYVENVENADTVESAESTDKTVKAEEPVKAEHKTVEPVKTEEPVADEPVKTEESVKTAEPVKTVPDTDDSAKLTDEQFEQYIKNKVAEAKKQTTSTNFVVADFSVSEANRITRIAANKENARLDAFRSKLDKDDICAFEFERVLTPENADTPVNITSITDIYRYMLQNSRVGDILTLPKCLLSKLNISELLGGTLETTGFTDNSGNTERVVLACMTYGEKRNVYLAGAMTMERYSPNVTFQVMIKHGDKNSVSFEKIKRDYFEWKQAQFRCN